MFLANESHERRASFHLGGNDDDLSDDSPPRTSPSSKQPGEGEALKRVNSIDRFALLIYLSFFLFSKKDSSVSKLASGSSLRKENFLTLAAMAASTSTASSTVKPDDKVAQDRFMQYQKQAKLKAEQVKLRDELLL